MSHPEGVANDMSQGGGGKVRLENVDVDTDAERLVRAHRVDPGHARLPVVEVQLTPLNICQQGPDTLVSTHSLPSRYEQLIIKTMLLT